MSVEHIADALNNSLSKGSTKLVLIGLCNHADHDGRCFPSVRKLGIYAGISPRQVTRHLNRLENLGEIKRVTVGHGRRATTYEITLHKRKPDIHDRGVIHDSAAMTSMSPQPLYDHHKSVSEVDHFSTFWDQYPKKVGKKDAKKKFQAELKEVEFDTIMSGLKRLNENLPEYRFIPHPATWLSHGRYNDEHQSGTENQRSSRRGKENNRHADVFHRIVSNGKTHA